MKKVFVLVYDGDAISVHDTAEDAIRAANKGDFDPSFMVFTVNYYETQGEINEPKRR
jgi:hypothetical protein